MNVVIFSGPTISPEDVAGHIDAVCLPPVAQGDVYKALELEPRAIGIIDGYFQGVPAVWHKEILWALSRGVRVFGSASMGALRAAELHAMGMTGVGRIFEDYRSGVLEDDDEVAVQHGPAELGYPALSVPMVNLRATVGAARRAGVIDEAVGDDLLAAGKAIFYPHRTWTEVFKQTGAECAEFGDWLEAGYVDQKRLDAEAMLAEMRRELTAGLASPGAGEPFEWTLVWQRLVDEAAVQPGVDDEILDELRLQPALFRLLREQARLRVLVLDDFDASGVVVSTGEQGELKTALRERHNLMTQAEFSDWLERNDLSPGTMDAIMAQEAVYAKVMEDVDDTLGPDLIVAAKLGGHFEALKDRAKAKSDAIGNPGVGGTALAETGMLSVQLVTWYFRKRLGEEVPARAGDHARAHGFASLAKFHECIAREYLFLQAGDNAVKVP